MGGGLYIWKAGEPWGTLGSLRESLGSPCLWVPPYVGPPLGCPNMRTNACDQRKAAQNRQRKPLS